MAEGGVAPETFYAESEYEVRSLKSLKEKIFLYFGPEVVSLLLLLCLEEIHFFKKISKNWTYLAYSLDFVEKLFNKFNFYGLPHKSREIFNEFY